MSRHVDVPAVAIAGLEFLLRQARDTQNLGALCGRVGVVVAAMSVHAEDSDAVFIGLQFLYKASYCRTRALRALAPHADAVVSAMTQARLGHHDATVSWASVRLLRRLSSHAANQRALAVHVDAVVSAMAQHVTYPDVASDGMQFLRNVAQYVANLGVLVTRAGAAWGIHDRVEPGLEFFALLSSWPEYCRDGLLAVHIGTVVRMMQRSWAPSLGLQVLGNLATFDVNNAAIIPHVDAVVSAVTARKGDVAVVTAGVQLLRSIASCANDAHRRLLMPQVGGVVSLMTQYSSDRGVAKDGMRFLYHLSCVAANVPDMLSAGVVAAVRCVMARHDRGGSPPSKVQRYGDKVLRKLEASVPLGSPVVAHDD